MRLLILIKNLIVNRLQNLQGFKDLGGLLRKKSYF